IADVAIAHGNHLIMTWMMDNTVTREGRYKQIWLDKDAAKEKIDGPSALVMANVRRIAQPPEVPAEDPDLIVVYLVLLHGGQDGSLQHAVDADHIRTIRTP